MMSGYALPASLTKLHDWLAAQGADDFKTERQCAFMAQQLAGTRFRFPPKGASCRNVLEAIQRSLPAVSANNASQSAGKRKNPVSARSRKPVSRRNRLRENPLRPISTTVPHGLVIYADGACEPNPGQGGWGFVVYRDGVEIHCESGGDLDATNQTMELTAALMALRWFEARGVIEPVRLFSDSAYTVNGANDWRHGWKAKGWRRGGPNAKPENAAIANLALWKALDAALTAVPIKLEWVKGHAGIIGNERADELSLIGRDDVLAAADPLQAIREQLDYSARVAI